jgi:hypothetical protein
MPVTLRPRPDIKVEPIQAYHLEKPNGTWKILQQSGGQDAQLAKNILASTIPAIKCDADSAMDVRMPPSQEPINPRGGCKNGLVNAALSAYLSHNHLILRPEDVWFAILAQFSIYINTNAERARELFVNHEGKEKLTTDINPGEYGVGVRDLAWEIQNKVKMHGLKDWTLPNFSTTTETDLEVASIMLMGAMQHYFSYEISIICGLPYVTLLGERHDYQCMLDRLPFLKDMGLGPEVTLWALHLERVLQGLVNSFDGDNEANRDFWNAMSKHYPSELCGASERMSGWLTAFCFWNNDGKQFYKCSEKDVEKGCHHEIETDDMPAGLISVPLTLEGDGATKECRMYAGLAGIEYKRVDARGNKTGSEEIEMFGSDPTPNSVQPISGWWLCEAVSVEQKEEEDELAMQQMVADLKNQVDKLGATA